MDDYTGEKVFKGNAKGAIRKHSTSKTSDTDHITPIGVIIKRHKRLTIEQQPGLILLWAIGHMSSDVEDGAIDLINALLKTYEEEIKKEYNAKIKALEGYIK